MWTHVTSAGVTFTSTKASTLNSVLQEKCVIFSNALNLETGSPGYILK